MAAMLRIGLISILVITVAAKLEYDAEKVKQLPYYKTDAGPPLDYVLINSDAGVLFQRQSTPGKKGIRFVVSAAETKNNPKELPGQSKTSSNTDACKGRPKLRAVLQKHKSPTSECAGTCEQTPQDFCLRGLHITIIKRNFGPQMRVIVRFQNPESKETIGIEMDAFKPPKDELNERLGDDVVGVSSPIPLPEFEKPSLRGKEEGDYKYQSFVSDITWMKNVLPRAKYIKHTRIGEDKSHAEWYMAGAIIIQGDAIKKILSLEKDFERLASEEKKNTGYKTNFLLSAFSHYLN